MAIAIVKKIRIDLSDIKGKGANERKRQAMQEVREYLEDTILNEVSKGNSPVAGQGKFRDLTSKYKKIKLKESSSGKPNLELTGDMLDDFEVRIEASNKISLGIHQDASDTSKLKAENHNKWTNRSKKKVLKGERKGQYIVPKRQFIPKGKQNLTKDIMDDVKEIVESYADQDN